MHIILQKIVEEYKNKILLYEDFCLTVFDLMEALLKDKGYKYQISYRIKEIDSLKNKIVRKRRAGQRYKSLADIEDLAGIRIMAYLESDRKKIIKDISRELSSSIKLEETEKTSGYIATHIIATLGGERLKLVEYKKFKGLKVEIQVVSILTHAWAEIEHDIVYKPSPANNGKGMDSIQDGLKNIFYDYIKKASFKLEKTAKEAKKITKSNNFN